jgi:hypothetical protein
VRIQLVRLGYTTYLKPNFQFIGVFETPLSDFSRPDSTSPPGDGAPLVLSRNSVNDLASGTRHREEAWGRDREAHLATLMKRRQSHGVYITRMTTLHVIGAFTD